MDVFLKLFIGLFLVFILTGCIGEEYDFTPPTVTLNDYPSLNEELIEANIDWRIGNNEQLEKETEDILSFAREQKQFRINSGQKVSYDFDNQDFAIEELNVSVWKNDKEKKLELNDERSFHFPKEDGKYVIVFDLRSDRGTAQYVGNIAIQ